MIYTKQELIEILSPALVTSTGSKPRDVRQVLDTYTVERLNAELARQRRAGLIFQRAPEPEEQQAPQQTSSGQSEQELLDQIRAEARRQVENDPEGIRQQQQDEREVQEFYRDYYLEQLFRTAIPGYGIPIRNQAAEKLVLSWVNPGETLNREFLKNAIQDNPTLASSLQWQSADPMVREQAAAQRVAQARQVFGIVCRKHNLSLAEANFRLLYDGGLLDSEYSADQAITSNAVALAQATPQEAAKFHQERVDDYNEALLKADPKELRARVREEAEQRRSADQQSDADEALGAAKARDAARGGFPPLPSEFTRERIRNASPSELKLWMKRYGNYQLNTRLAGKEL
jgi:hypothetical protein